MARRSKITGLPDEVRRWLDRALAEAGFAEYAALAEALKERGYQIGKSSLHRYGQSLERKLAAVRASTEAARAIADAAPDDADLRSAATMSLVQTEIFGVLVELQEAEAEDDPGERLKLLSRAAKSIAELSRASVNQKKWETETRARVSAAASAAEKIAARGGLSADAVEQIRAQILGITA